MARNQVADVIPIDRARQRRGGGWAGNTNVEQGERNSAMTSFVGLLIQQGGLIESIYQNAHRANQRHLQPPLPEDELTKLLDSVIQRWAPEEAQQIGVIRPLGFY